MRVVLTGVASARRTGDALAVSDNLIYEPFVDSTQLDAVTGVSFATANPTKDELNPLFPTGSNTDTWDYHKGYVTCNKIGDVWHLHYRAFDDSDGVDDTSRLCYATSSDGVTFTKPTVGSVSYGGNTANNIVVEDHVVEVVCDVTTGSWVYVNEEIPGASASSDVGIYTSSSPTGPFTKRKQLGGPTFTEGRSIVRRPDGRWIVYYSIGHATQARRQEAWLSDTTSIDGSWTNQGTVIASGGSTAQIYGMGVTRIGGVYYANVMRYNKTTEQISMEMHTSRDGLSWSLLSSSWIPLGADTAWDDEMILQGGKIVEDGNDWHIYYAGSPVDHAAGPSNDVRIGRATIGKDRAGGVTGTGSATTDPIAVPANATLFVNCDASGGGKIEIDVLDGDGEAIDGFAAADMTDITTDTFAITPWWGGESMPTGQTVKLKFNLTSATLYSYRITT